MVAEVGMGEGMNEDDALIIKAATVLRAAGYKVEADPKSGVGGSTTASGLPTDSS